MLHHYATIRHLSHHKELPKQNWMNMIAENTLNHKTINSNPKFQKTFADSSISSRDRNHMAI